MTDANTVFATYRVRPGREREFHALLERHWPTLRKLELVTDEPAVTYRGEEDGGRPYYVEIFTWRDADAPEKAHELPAVAEVWEAMGELVEARGKKPKFEFPHLRRLDVRFAAV